MVIKYPHTGKCVFCRNRKLMPAIHHRICIYTKDIQRITGKSERYARLLIEKVRKANEKKKGDLITVDEFCQYTRLKKDQIEQFLKD